MKQTTYGHRKVKKNFGCWSKETLHLFSVSKEQ